MVDSAAATESQTEGVVNGVKEKEAQTDEFGLDAAVSNSADSVANAINKSEKSPAATTAPETTTQPTGADLPLSKSALKKLRRREKLLETRAEWKATKKAKEKERKIKKRDEKRLAAEAAKKLSGNGEARKRKSDEEEEIGSKKEDGGNTGEKQATKKQKVEKPPRKVLEPMTFILDCGFDDLMTEKEVISLSSQLIRCYSANRQSLHQVSLRLTSLNSRLLDRFQGILKNQHLSWKNVTFTPEDYDICEGNKDNLVYLTADSDDTIEELEPGKSYIIGGIVDRNRHKNLCYKKATAQGIKTGKLPIGEYINMSSRYVLTTNQVVEIMLKWLEHKDWKKAFMEVIPQRKMPAAKEREEPKEEEDGVEGEVRDKEAE